MIGGTIKIMREQGFDIGMRGIWHGRRDQWRFMYFA